MAKLRSGTFTVCLDTSKASDVTYQNWATFKLTRRSKGCYRIDRLSNAEGNGQRWELAGIVTPGACLLLKGSDSLTVMVGTVFARHFRLSYRRELTVSFPKARVFNPRGRKTAAPSLLRPNKVRDKNRNRARELAHSVDLAGEMAKRS